MKIFVALEGVMVFSFGISGCQKSDIQINVIVRDMLKMEGLASNYIECLANYQDFQFDILSITVDDKEINTYINEVVENSREWGDVVADAEEQYICQLFEQDDMAGVRQKVQTILSEEKTDEYFMAEKKRFFEFMSERSMFSLDENELVQYAAAQSVYYINLAFMNGMTLSEYIAYNGQDEELFYDTLYQDAEAEVKRYLIVGALSAAYGITVTDAEFKAECEDCGYTQETLKNNDTLGLYIRYYLLEEKVFEFCGNFS